MGAAVERASSVGSSTRERASSEDRQSGLQTAVQRASCRLGHSAVAGRYHTPPSKLEDDYEISVLVLGTGCSGAVHLATRKQTEEKFAVKSFALEMLTEKDMQDLQMEAQIYLGLDHPHVARLVDVYQSLTHVHMIMELCSGGELLHRVNKGTKFTETNAAEAFHQMLLAVNYLHVHDIVHTDLKLDNFMYEKEGSDHLKLIDFGLSDIWNRKTTLTKTRGTLSYMAPEVLQGSYTTKCDIWSLGVILFVLLGGYMPFRGSKAEVRRDISLGDFNWNDAEWKDVSAAAQDLVRSILTVDPDMRPSAGFLLANQWLTTTRRCPAEKSVDPSVAVALQQMSHYSRFRRMCLSMMAWSLSQRERESVRKYFMAIDKNRDGSISLQEFRQALRQSRSPLDDVAIQEAFQAIDVAGNNEINYTEFLAAMVDVESNDRLVWAAFNRLDADSSGHITIANLKQVLGAGFSAREIETILSHADADCDGKISYDDFYTYLKKTTEDGEQLADDDQLHRAISKAPKRDEDFYVDESCAQEKEDAFLTRLFCGGCLYT